MKNKHNTLLLLLIMTAVLIADIGAYLKYSILVPMELYQDESIVAVPFLLLADEEFMRSLTLNKEAAEPAVNDMNSADPTEQIVQPETEPPTEAATEPLSESPTESPTELVTEPPTEPITVDESWFDDALFIGDSRTQSMQAYAPLGKAHYFCDTGMSVFHVRYAKCSNESYRTTDLSGLLSQYTYGKVYIMLGINGMHRSHDEILAEYQNLIDLIREKQPDTVIVLNGIMTVGRYKAASRAYYSIDNIYSLNEKIAKLAVGDKMFYIDVNELVADEEGYLPDEMSKDGCHLYGKYYIDWSQWLIETAATFGVR